ncbi:MAG: AAA family ATPase [Deltaproteobacteria bacterium]|nr:AAA family ATPase [Deltaproteobacteria bacterium]
MNRTTTFAMCGKGGVGKTSVSALMVRHLAKKRDKKILAIDADPSGGLASALGMRVAKSVDDIRKDLIHTIKGGRAGDSQDTLNMLDYEIFDALEEAEGFALLAIGRSEDEGCYCKVNAFLKEIIADLAESFDYVLIDGEAGIEQINRRVMKTVDHLILLSDTSAKGITVAETIHDVATANNAVDCSRTVLVLNRVRSEKEVLQISKRVPFELIGWIPEDDLIRDFDFEGRSLFELPPSSPAKEKVAGILETMGF